MSKFNINSKVTWNSEAGHTSGTIRKIHTKPFYLTGKDGTKYLRHASKDNPVYEIKSSKTDHIAYHYGDALHKYAKGGPIVTYYDFDGNPIEDINKWGNPNNLPTTNPNIIEPLYNSAPTTKPTYTPNKSWFINPDGSISLDYVRLANDRTSYGRSTYDNYTNRLTAYDGTYGYNRAMPGDFYKDGGIHIKKSHQGLFTQWAKDNGFSSVQSAASHVLTNKDNYSTHVVQMANFAKNTTKFHHKKYDGGGKVINDQRDWLESYLNSPKYKERLQKEFPGKDITNELKQRKINFEKEKIIISNNSLGKDYGSLLGYYVPQNYNTNVVDPLTEKPFKKSSGKKGYIPHNIYLEKDWDTPGYETIPLHEMGHGIDDAGYRIPTQTVLNIANKVNNVNRKVIDPDNIKYLGDGERYEDYHFSPGLAQTQYNNIHWIHSKEPVIFGYETSPSEFINRLQPIRYLLNKEGIYDAKNQDFKDEDFDKMMNSRKIKNNVHFQDIWENIRGKTDEEKKKNFIWFMNNIAKNDNLPTTNIAKDGGAFNYKKYALGGPSSIDGDINGDGVLDDDDEKYKLSIITSQNQPNINTTINTDFSLKPNKPFDKGFGYGATSASTMGSAAKQAFDIAENIRTGIIGLNQDLAKGSLALTSALSTNLNQPEQKKKSIRQAIDDGSYNQDFGRLYYADGGNVTNYNVNTPNISQIATRPQGANAEVEQGEVIKLPDGSTIPIEGNNAFKHYENNNVGSMGTPVNIPDNSFIYSDRKIKGEPTKLNKQVASDILNKTVKKSMSMGDIAKKLDNTKYDKILNDVSAIPIQKRTAAINKEMNTVKLKQLADYQESFKLLQNPQNKFADGGSFDEAFAKAYRENPGGIFIWKGKRYLAKLADDASNTDTKDDKTFSQAFRQAYNTNPGGTFEYNGNVYKAQLKDSPSKITPIENKINPEYQTKSGVQTFFPDEDISQYGTNIPTHNTIDPKGIKSYDTVLANPDYDKELREYNNMNPVLKLFAKPPSRLPKPIEFAINPMVMSSITGVGSPLSYINSFEELGTGITKLTKPATDAVKEMVRRNIQEEGELAGRKILNMKETTPELKAIKEDLLNKYYELVDEGTKKIPGLKEHYQASSKPLNNVRELDKVLPKPTARVGRTIPNPNITKPKTFVRRFFSEPKPDPTKPWWNIFKDGGNKFPNGGYLTNADIPEGYSPDIAQGYYDANGNYINAQPTDANYRNPRYMFLKPNSSELPWYYGPFANNSNQIIAPDFTPNPANIEQDLTTAPKKTPKGVNNPVVNPYQEHDETVNTSVNRRSLADIASNINWGNVGKSALNGINNAVGWAGNVLDSAMGALPGLVGVLSDVPVNGNPIDLQYLPNARQNNSVTRRVQDQIATKFNERAKFMNPALQQAYDAQLVANTAPILEEAAATDYQNYLRQQDAINNANIQTSNKEDMINNQDQARVNELLMRKRDSNIRDIQTSLQNAYTQRMGNKKERNTLSLLNQLSPNYQYNPNQPNQGVQFVYDEEGNPYIKRQDASGKIFYEPAVTGTKKEDETTKKKRSIKK